MDEYYVSSMLPLTLNYTVGHVFLHQTKILKRKIIPNKCVLVLMHLSSLGGLED